MSENCRYEEKPYKPIYNTQTNVISNGISNDVMYALLNTNNALLIALGEEISNIKLNSNKLLTELTDEIKNIKSDLNKVILNVNEVKENLSQFDVGVDPTEDPEDPEEQEDHEDPTEDPTEEQAQEDPTEEPEDSNIIDKVN